MPPNIREEKELANPSTEDAAYWESALEHYHSDRLEEAYAAIKAHGIGEAGAYLRWYRLIEAEYVTRLRSQVTELRPWLTFENVPEETHDVIEELQSRTIEACDQIATRLGWTHSTPTRVAILARETDAPWATNPYGYCTDKYPFCKICLPDHLVEDPDEFFQAVAHEYAHVVSLTLADGHAPRWLEEAVSVLAENRFEEDAIQELLDGAWLTPEDLEEVFDSQSGPDDEAARDIWLAYQQSGLIGQYLASLEDETKLGSLLKEHTHEGLWRNLSLQLRGKGRVDAAMEATYRKTVPQVFQEALAWTRAKHSS